MKKAVIIFIRGVVLVCNATQILISILLLKSFFLSPTIYPIGTETIDKAGWSNYSELTFIFYHSVIIFVSTIFCIVAIKSQSVRNLLLLLSSSFFLAICSVFIF